MWLLIVADSCCTQPARVWPQPLLTNIMWLHIFCGACYHLFWMFSCLYAIPVILPGRYEVGCCGACPLHLCICASGAGCLWVGMRAVLAGKAPSLLPRVSARVSQSQHHLE